MPKTKRSKSKQPPPKFMAGMCSDIDKLIQKNQRQIDFLLTKQEFLEDLKVKICKVLAEIDQVQFVD